jgi:hypothetical protein
MRMQARDCSRERSTKWRSIPRNRTSARFVTGVPKRAADGQEDASHAGAIYMAAKKTAKKSTKKKTGAKKAAKKSKK